jgi:DNA-binding response OmpR family regulator
MSNITMSQKILIVDDNTATRAELVKLLADAGFETLTAGTVPDAMRFLSTAQPHLLITEIRLDTYNGLHLIAMAPKPIPAIVITGYPDRAVEADARRLGAEYLSKPVSPGELFATIQRTLTTAATRGTFLPPRADPRSEVPANTKVLVNDVPACLLDVSAGGARVEVQCAPGDTVRSPLAFRIEELDIALPLEVMWKRRTSDNTWLCGVSVAEDLRPEWQAFLNALLRPASV